MLCASGCVWDSSWRILFSLTSQTFNVYTRQSVRMLTWPARLHDGTFIFVFIHIKTEVFSKFNMKQRQVCMLVVFLFLSVNIFLLATLIALASVLQKHYANMFVRNQMKNSDYWTQFHPTIISSNMGACCKYLSTNKMFLLHNVTHVCSTVKRHM